MQIDSARVEEIFGEALGKPDDGARAAYLDEACAENMALLERVQALLAAHDATENRLALPEANGATIAYIPLAEGPGTKIGRYKLLEQIGEGGFGVVFMAEQEEPVRRRVALKIIKLGMDTKQVVARFEAERQALAMMDHPNIAKVLDGGATETGRPYFVMELVRGEPITRYCDENKLTTIDRLKLFVAVCSAVQHAHQKGIIHRDLKPSNVLVSTQDDRAMVKVIDFGVAKATQARLTERTLFTEFHQLIGTPAYMSPEQTGGSLDVDTRSDVYSLGVLLYELLTGATPFASKDLLNAGYAEMQRMIREVEPLPPSTRLLSPQDSLPSVAALRRAEPTALAKTLRGDLDWIVMRCLEKDRTRRYETATSLSQDIEHYLTDEPVKARRPTRIHRLKKFIRRNKAGVASGAMIVAALTLGLILAFAGLLHARRQARIARTQAVRSEQIAKFLQNMLKSVGPGVASGRDTRLLQEIVDKTIDRMPTELKDQPDVEIQLRLTLAEAYSDLQLYPKVVETARETLRVAEAHQVGDSLDKAIALRQVAGALFVLRKQDEAEDAVQQSLAMLDRIGAGDSLDAAYALDLFGNILRHQGKVEESEKAIRSALATERRLQTSDDDRTAFGLNGLSITLFTAGKNDEAERAIREAADIHARIHGADHIYVSADDQHLCAVLTAQGKLDEAEVVGKKAIEIQEKIEGKGRLYQLWSHFNLAVVLRKEGKLAEALAHAQAAVDIARTQGGDDYPDLVPCLMQVAKILSARGKPSDARGPAEEAVAICRRGKTGEVVAERDAAVGLLRTILTELGDSEALEALTSSVRQDKPLKNGSPDATSGIHP